MVQRKAENKLGTKLESKNSIKSEKRTALRPSQYQEELKKKMKKVRSLKKGKFGEQENLKFCEPGVDQTGSVSRKKKLFPANISSGSPNYMKPTNSSDAKKENLQVSTHYQITDRKTLNYSKNLRYGNRGSSQPRNPSCSALKPVRILIKTSSFKPVRTSMKASLYPMNRATCSSILKDSKFPASIILNSGGTESEGTSVLNVCPYTYCSLNGHHHAPLPPLKRFLSARRRLLKTQKKSKELSAFKFKTPAEAKEIDTGQLILTGDSSIPEADMESSAMSALVEEEYFVEIYASPMPELAEKTTSDGRYEPKLNLLQTIDTVSDLEAYKELSNEAEMEDYCREIPDTQVEESYSQISLEDDLEQNHDLLVDVLVTLSECCKCGQEEDQDLANDLHYRQANQAEAASDILTGSDLDEDHESIEDIQLEETVYEASDMDWEEQEAPYLDNETENYMFSDGSDSETVPSPDEPIFESDYLAITFTETSEEVEILQDESEEDIMGSKAAICSEGAELDSGDHISERDISSDRDEVSDTCNDHTKDQVSEAFDLGHKLIEIESSDPIDQSSIENIVCRSTLSNSSDIASEEFAEVTEEKDDNPEQKNDEQLDENGAPIIQECDSLQNDQETEEGIDALQDGSPCNESKTDQYVTKEDHNPYKMNKEIEVKDCQKVICDDLNVEFKQMEAEETCPQANIESTTENGKIIIQTQGNTHGSLKERTNTTLKMVTEDQNDYRKFNPREPRYLEIQPDPDAEKVDLRHQMMDERKNAEEWMVDYALRQTVIKLAPARKMRVALLVEAFETVMPPAKCETRLQHSKGSFTHSRPLQACS